MNHLNTYTVEDMLALNSMIEVIHDNTNSHAYFDVRTVDSNGIWRLCLPEEILKDSVEHTMYKFICFFTPPSNFMDIPLTNLIYKETLENVPLYINKAKSLRLIAKWRLQIGK